MNELEFSPDGLAEASRVIGDEPVVMINLLSFRAHPSYPDDFQDKRATARAAYYEGYAGAFRDIAASLDIPVELVYAGKQLKTVFPREQEQWDDIVAVRYRSFADLRSIVDSRDYSIRAEPHRLAAVSDWRFVATRS